MILVLCSCSSGVPTGLTAAMVWIVGCWLRVRQASARMLRAHGCVRMRRPASFIACMVGGSLMAEKVGG